MGGLEMKPLHELYAAASGFELLLENDLKALKRHKDAMYREKDVFKIKDILNTLKNLEYDTARYREWAELETEATKK